MNEKIGSPAQETPPGSEKLKPTIAGGHLKETLELLQASIPRASLVPALKRLQGENGVSGNTEQESLKLEANALTGYFMVPVWESMRQWIHAHPDQLAAIPAAHFGKKAPEFASRRIEDIASEYDGDPRALADALYGSALSLAFHHADDLMLKYRSEAEHVSKTAQARNFQRFETVLQKRFSDDHSRRTPEAQLRAGFQAASVVTWAIMEAIPRLHSDATGEQIPREKLDELLKKGRTFALYLASLHVDVFGIVIGELLEFERRDNDAPLVFPFFTRNVTLDPNPNGEFLFKVNPEALERIAQQVQGLPQNTEARTGCPAIAARGPDGKNVVTEFYDWTEHVARAAYFPHAVK